MVGLSALKFGWLWYGVANRIAPVSANQKLYKGCVHSYITKSYSSTNW